MNTLEQIIDAAWEQRTEFSPKTAPAEVREAVAQVLSQLDAGTLRVAEKKGRSMARQSMGGKSRVALIPLRRQRRYA